MLFFLFLLSSGLFSFFLAGRGHLKIHAHESMKDCFVSTRRYKKGRKQKELYAHKKIVTRCIYGSRSWKLDGGTINWCLVLRVSLDQPLDITDFLYTSISIEVRVQDSLE